MSTIINNQKSELADDNAHLLDEKSDALDENIYPRDHDDNDSDDQADLLVFTDNAANKVKELLAEETDSSNLKLRAFVTGGGCSGFQYGFTFDDNQNDDDFVIEKNDVTLLVDASSMPYLEGATIDYKEDETGEQFVISNPNAQTTCGCGSSFSV